MQGYTGMGKIMTDTQLLHKANGIRRIRECVKNCNIPETKKGTWYSRIKIVVGWHKGGTIYPSDYLPPVFEARINLTEGWDRLWKK